MGKKKSEQLINVKWNDGLAVGEAKFNVSVRKGQASGKQE